MLLHKCSLFSSQQERRRQGVQRTVCLSHGLGHQSHCVPRPWGFRVYDAHATAQSGPAERLPCTKTDPKCFLRPLSIVLVIRVTLVFQFQRIFMYFQVSCMPLFRDFECGSLAQRMPKLNITCHLFRFVLQQAADISGQM